MKPPTVSLRPLHPDGFDAFVERAAEAYAASRAVAVSATFDDAVVDARAQTASLVPQGFATPGHEVMERDVVVGQLWIATTEVDGFRSAVVYDVSIRERLRGRGRQAMKLAEDVARRLGARDVELHVFAHNAAAVRVYERLGYRTASLGMRKTLGVGSGDEESVSFGPGVPSPPR